MSKKTNKFLFDFYGVQISFKFIIHSLGWLLYCILKVFGEISSFEHWSYLGCKYYIYKNNLCLDVFILLVLLILSNIIW